MSHANMIAVINGKGGVGKTTIAANVAGMAAAKGLRTLAVDLDPQGNLGLDLGYDGDDGASLGGAVAFGTDPQPLVGVRDNLDVLPGGPHLDRVRIDDTAEARTRLRDALSPLAARYEIVVVDCPPGEASLQWSAIAASRWLLIPARADDGSRGGLRRVARLYWHARESGTNPDLEVLGVVLFDVDVGATVVREQITTAIAEDLGEGGIPVFATAVRHAPGLAFRARRLHLLAHELEAAADRAARDDSPAGRISPQAAANLAGDYAALTTEVLREYASRLERHGTPPQAAAPEVVV